MSAPRTTRSVSPPGLSRASTPDSNAPATPVLPSAFLQSSKMASHKPSVGFASPLATSAYRIPHWDELSVMRAFAAHARHCDQCDEAMTHRLTLCRTGTELAKDIGTYFYCSAGKPYSHIDRRTKGERVQVEVPAEYALVKTLFDAISDGLRYANLKQRRPEIHHAQTAPSSGLSRRESTTERYEIKPSTSSRKHRANTYTAYGNAPEVTDRAPKYETRSPYDERYRDEDKPKRAHNRGSLYESPERKSKRKSYVLPVSSSWLR